MVDRSENGPNTDVPRPRFGRRRLLGSAAALGGAAGLGSWAGAAAQPSPATPPEPDLTQSVPVQELKRRVFSAAPLLLEAPVNDLQGIITPNRVHFVRSHYNTPMLDADTWSLSVEGAVSRPMRLSLADLTSMPATILTAFIECSGNSRGNFQPRPQGTGWSNGAISVAEWTGVSLARVLQIAGAAADTNVIAAEGLDSGKVYTGIPYEKALDPDTIIAYAQNGEALNRENGYPVRLIVPGWGGIKSIKWLGRIEVVRGPFASYYGDRTYVYETPGLPKTPVQAVGVKSFITRPAADAELLAGRPAAIAGYAYSGHGTITRVEVSVDGGPWREARLLPPALRWAWVRWQFDWEAPAGGEAVLRSRATDDRGNVQPETVAWNRYGYGYNAIQQTKVKVN